MTTLTKPEPSLLARFAGVSLPVKPGLYAATGFGLMLVKYVGEAALVWQQTGEWISPWRFLSPSFLLRFGDTYNALPNPELTLWILALWTLPFVWVGVSMTVRRAKDAGLPSWTGIGFFIPIVNYLVMLTLCFLPSVAEGAKPDRTLKGEERVMWAALSGVIGGSVLGLGMTVFSVFVLGEYGSSLFIGTPFAMGVTGAFLLNLRQPRSWMANAAMGVLMMGSSGGLLTLFALEGLICLAMAAPLAMVLCWMGVFFGYGLARWERRLAVLGSVLPLPLLGILEPAPGHTEIREVVTSVDIQASPEEVWDNVIGFGGVELPPPPEWYFRTGIAYPIRARIEGEGVGAVRYCEFSTGPFVEPITVWDPPRHLAFDVQKSPPTMEEWSPYNTVHAPHLDGILQSHHGEFRLIPLPDGGTRLEGHTWYSFAMAPIAWWGLWSDASIHAIHTRVLAHIKQVAEAS